MPVKIEINGTTAGEALGELRDLSAGLLGASPPRQHAPEPEADRPDHHATETPAPAAEPPKKTRAKKVEAPAPAPEPEPAEVQAQDEADEAAEEGTDAPDRTYTIDDVRAIAGSYTKKFGLPAAQEDGKKVFEKHGHKGKLSDITDPDVLAAIVVSFQAALDNNTFARKEVA
jgi:hypothetical protein